MKFNPIVHKAPLQHHLSVHANVIRLCSHSPGVLAVIESSIDLPACYWNSNVSKCLLSPRPRGVAQRPSCPCEGYLLQLVMIAAEDYNMNDCCLELPSVLGLALCEVCSLELVLRNAAAWTNIWTTW